MRKLSAVLLIFILLMSLCLPILAAEQAIVAPATGYQDADDVQYKYYSKNGKQVIANWGARGETCTFLSSYAERYYTSNYTWNTMSQISGGNTIGNAYLSDLYKSLQNMMQTKHTYKTSYGETRYLYCYTDCQKNDYLHISSFYSGKTLSGTWDGGSTWNREHTWPKSKTAYTSVNNSSINEATDIMSLRPASVSENSSRGNTAYGEGSSYFDPGVSVRGDCARIMLYVYVRWGNTGRMWGSNGVMENLDVMLKWMKEDPVDTWEMARNDSVQSITGVRNVFVDYPEYAWLLFGREIPKGMSTPSGKAANICAHAKTQLRNQVSAQCTESGYSGDTYCLDCGTCIATGTTISATGHRRTQLQNKADATCGKAGYTGDVYCLDCEKITITGIPIPATGKHSFSEWLLRPGGGHKDRVCQTCGYVETEPVPSSCAHVSEYIVTIQPTCTAAGWGGNFCSKCNNYLGEGKDIPATGHQHTEIRNKSAANCTTSGHTGDTWCTDCNTKIKAGQTIPATGHQHTELRNKAEANCTTDGFTGDTYCTDCNAKTVAGEVIPATGHQHTEVRNKAEANCTTDGFTGDTYCTDCNTKTVAGEVIPATGHQHTEVRNKAAANCTTDGFTGDTYCSDCNTKTVAGEVIPATGHQHTEVRNKAEANCTTDGFTGDTYCSDCNTKTVAGEVIPATGHQHTEVRNKAEANCTTDGFTGDTYCTDCNTKTADGEVIPATGHGDVYHRNQKDATCSTDGHTGDAYCVDCDQLIAGGSVIPATGHLHTEIRGQKDATCAEAGSTGNTYCADCNTKIADGETIPATADHVYGPIAPGGQQTYQECTICGHRVVIDLEDDRPGVDWVVIGIAAAAIVIIGGGIVAIVIIKKRKR